MGTEGEEEEEVSVFRWRYDETCEGRYCCGDCDKCDKEDEPVDDLISRQAMMKEFADFVRKSNNSDFAPTPTWNDAVSLVGSMPTADLSEYCDKLWKTAYERGKAEAHPKKGKWKEVQVVIGRDGDFTTKEYECEICGYRQYFPENYCGRCGTRMEE